MRFKLWIESTNRLTAYHVTDSAAANEIMKRGFDLSKARKIELGLGIYLTLGDYANSNIQHTVRIQCEVSNVDKFLSLQGSGRSKEQSLQFVRMGIPEQIANILVDPFFGTDAAANKIAVPFIMKNFRGLITNNGIVVVYHVEDVRPVKTNNYEVPKIPEPPPIDPALYDDIPDYYN